MRRVLLPAILVWLFISSPCFAHNGGFSAEDLKAPENVICDLSLVPLTGERFAEALLKSIGDLVKEKEVASIREVTLNDQNAFLDLWIQRLSQMDSDAFTKTAIALTKSKFTAPIMHQYSGASNGNYLPKFFEKIRIASAKVELSMEQSLAIAMAMAERRTSWRDRFAGARLNSNGVEVVFILTLPFGKDRHVPYQPKVTSQIEYFAEVDFFNQGVSFMDIEHLKQMHNFLLGKMKLQSTPSEIALVVAKLIAKTRMAFTYREWSIRDETAEGKFFESLNEAVADVNFKDSDREAIKASIEKWVKSFRSDANSYAIQSRNRILRSSWGI